MTFHIPWSPLLFHFLISYPKLERAAWDRQLSSDKISQTPFIFLKLFLIKFDADAGSFRWNQVSLFPLKRFLDNLVKEMARLKDTLLYEKFGYVGIDL